MKKNVFSLLFCTVSIIAFGQPKSTQFGKIIPYQSFTTLSDSIIYLRDSSQKKYVLVDYYFSACKPCNNNLSKLEKLKSKFTEKLIVVSINPIDSKEKVIAHQQKFKISNSILYGKSAIATRQYFGLSSLQMGFPYYILISPQGTILYESGNQNGFSKKIAKLIQ